jgi:hypothetical protein
MGYHNDRRVIAANTPSWAAWIDEEHMTAGATFYEDDEGCEREIPFKWEVCPTCHGKGKHVNPSIDAGGINGEDFEADRDFYNDYRAGVYDVRCYECKGRRVVPVPADKKDIEAYETWLRLEAIYQNQCAAEREMGA